MRKLFTIALCFFLVHSLSAQQALRWIIEGALHSRVIPEGVSYSLYSDSINNIAYDQGVDPVIWGKILTRTEAGLLDSTDFEIIVESDNIAGSGTRQLTVYSADSSMDFQTIFDDTPLNQNIRIQFNIFEANSRINIPYTAGSGGTSKAAAIGFARPNTNITSVSRLHTAELYYVEDLTSNTPIGVTVVDTCNQIDTFITGLVGSDVIITGEDLDATWLADAKTNGTYPYDINSRRTYIHSRESTNTCDANGNNFLEVAEASYNVYFEPMASFIVGRQDILKLANGNTGKKSAIGFYLAPSFDPSRTPTLPIALTQFSGQLQENHIALQWTTASEINNDFFEVEHSKDGVSWTTIAQVQGAGNSTESINYDVRDFNFQPTTNYYRLKQVDFDGKSQYSKIIAVRATTQTAGTLEIYPNPTTAVVNIKSDLRAEQFNIQIFNNIGQDVSTHVLRSNRQLDLSNLPKGMYWLHIRDTQGTPLHNQKVMKY